MLIEILAGINLACGVIFFVCYALQLIYLITAIIKRPRKFPDAPEDKRYAVMIAARDEEDVIGYLIDSIRAQSYPSDLIDVYVAADNCTDKTADVAKAHGAAVYERHDTEHIGKGFVLHYLTDIIYNEKPHDYYDAFIIIDADNVLDTNFIREMNKCFSDGHRIITSYRNSKNFGDNWISAGSGLWFLREASQLNAGRMIIGSSCAVSGTGFLVSREIIEAQGGWKHFLMIEDIEFTIDNILGGEVIAYCPDAIIYDEQPTKLSQSWRQHVRWARGALQLLGGYGVRLVKGIFRGPRLACYDMLMSFYPAYIITLIGFIANIVSIITMAFTGNSPLFWSSVVRLLSGMYTMTYIMGLIAVITEWRRIHCRAWKKIFYTFTFPFFMATYLPEAVAALFSKASWKPIHHTVQKTLEDIESQKN